VAGPGDVIYEARSEEQGRRLIALYAQDVDATKVELFACRLSPIRRRLAPLLLVVRRSNQLLSLAGR